MAPSGRLAARPAGWFPDWLVTTAAAVPVEGERPVGDATVRALLVSPDGTAQQALVETTTDALGRYCVRIPDDAEFGPRMMLEAKRRDVRLRRFAPDPLDGNISVQTEALVRLVLARATPKRLSRARLVNLQTMADTTLDLMNRVSLDEGHGVDVAVEKVAEALASDPRIAQTLREIEGSR